MAEDDEAARAQRRSAAVDAVRAAVLEIRELNSKEGSEDAMREAKGRLGAAIKAAKLAGATSEELIEASSPPPAQEEQELGPGDEVEVFGLESASGRQLNGRRGRVVAFVEEKGRFQLELGPDGHAVSIKPANLRRPASEPAPSASTEGSGGGRAAGEERDPSPSAPAPAPGDSAAAAEEATDDDAPLAVGDAVEVFGLESESGSKLNGRTGKIVEYQEDKGRFKVELASEEFVSIKPANLRRRRRKEAAAPPSGEEQGADEEGGEEGEEGGGGSGEGGGEEESKRARSASAGSSSSSSSSSKPAKKKAKKSRKASGFSGGFSGGMEPPKKKSSQLTPEEALERLLQGKSGGAPPESRRSSRKADPEAMDPEERAAQIARDAGAAAAAAAAAMASASKEPLKLGDRVEVFGLQSAAGKLLNGKTGLVTKWDQAKGRFLVELGGASLQSLKPENLRRHIQTSFFSSGVDSGYSGSSAGYTLL